MGKTPQRIIDAINRYRKTEKGRLTVAKYNKSRYKIRRLKVLVIFGNGCSCKNKNCWHNNKCQITDKRVLQIDHINNGGYNHKKFQNAKVSFYNEILRNPEEAKKQYQLLCANCNLAKYRGQCTIKIKFINTS